MKQSYNNHKVAGDIERAINLIENNAFYLRQFGIDETHYGEALNSLRCVVDMLKQGGSRMQRDAKGRAQYIGNQNLTTPEPIRPTRPSSVKPGSSIMNVD